MNVKHTINLNALVSLVARVNVFLVACLMSVIGVTLSLNQASALTLQPTVIYSETFDASATGAANVSAAYPDYVLSTPGSTDANVTGGVLELVKPTNTVTSFLTSQTFVNETMTIKADVGASSASGGGNDATGLVIGNRAFVIFTANGTFRPLALGTGPVPSQQAMGFPADRDVMHHFEVNLTPNGPGADIVVKVTNGASPFQTYTMTILNDTTFVPGQIGFYNRYNTSNVGLFDNLEVTALRFVVPEPSSICLLGLGLFFVTRRRRARS